jgi:chaperone required for assembly of F1-ATPase
MNADEVKLIYADVVFLQCPEGGSCLSVDGRTINADEDGVVCVPVHVLADLFAHGFRPAVAKLVVTPEVAPEDNKPEKPAPKEKKGDASKGSTTVPPWNK